MTDIIANSTDQNLPMLGRHIVRHRALAGDSFKQLAERAENSLQKTVAAGQIIFRIANECAGVDYCLSKTPTPDL